MPKLELKKIAGVSLLSMGLVVGVAGFAGATTGTITNTGYDSTNEVEHKTSTNVDVDNDNEIKLRNDNEQRAWSGDSVVKFNTTGGGAMTGSASNANAVAGTVEINNAGATAAAGNWAGKSDASSSTGHISNTGADSRNQVKYEHRTDVDVNNTNDVYISNSNEQTAKSGDAAVLYNTTGGSASTGSVSNTSSSSFTVRVTN